MNALDGMAVIVTGGSSGIGRAAALRFAAQGARVVITGRRAGPLQETAALHANIVAHAADAADPAGAASTVATSVDAWGRLDVVVNNAGAGAMMALADATAEQIETIFRVNVTGPSLLAAAALPHLRPGGVIINVSSTYGHRPIAGLSHYAASKAALEHLTRCWALELAPRNIRVNAVAAGPTKSGALTGMMRLSPQAATEIEEMERMQIPLKRRGAPEDIARWIVHLADPGSEWVTGQVITVDGGLELT